MIENAKDNKIIAQLIENARMPISILARRTRLNREVVQYRLKNLEKNLIASYQARINLKFFSDAIYTIYLNLPGERKAIISKLKKLPQIHWIGNTLGRYNYIISFSVNKENTLKKFLDKFSEEFQNINYVLSQQIEEHKDTFSGLLGTKNTITSQKETGRYELDKLDKEIINELTENARYSNSEIAEKIDSTRETIRMRIKNLEKNQVILNYRTIIKPQALKLENYFISIKSNNLNSRELSKIASYISNFNNSSYVCITAGEFNVISVIHIKSNKELDNFCIDLQSNFKEINQIETFPLVEVGSQEYIPKASE